MLACLLCGQLCLSWKPSWFTALRHGLCAPFLQCLGHLSLHGTVNEYQLSNWWLGLTVGGSTFITRTQWTLAMTLWSWWQHYKYLPVMWSETVGLRTRPVWDQKKIGLGLAGFVLCCETQSCHARRHNDLGGHSSFSSAIFSFSILCLEHHYCDQQWRSLT